MAARHWVGGNSTWDNTAGTKWSLTAGGAGGQAVPTSGDDVFLDNGAGTGNVTVTISAVCKTLDCTNYANTLAGTTGITASGSVTFVAGMTLTWSGLLQVNASATLTSGGQTINGGISLIATATFTFGDAFAITGTLTCNVGTVTIAGAQTLTVAGGITISTTTSATATIVMTGGSWGGAAQITATEIKFQGTITVSNNAKCTGNKITYVSGTITCSGTFILGNCTMDTNGMTWNNIQQVTNQTNTLSSNMAIAGNMVGLGANTWALNGAGKTLSIGGSMTQTGGAWSGTAKIIFTGAGTWTGSSTFAIDVDFNASGTITLSGTITFLTKTMTYVAGTVAPGSSTLAIGGSCTLDTAGANFNNVNVTVASNITINSLLTVNATLSVTHAVSTTTFIGTSGWTCATFSCTVAGQTLTIKAAATYTATSSFVLTGTAASPITFRSGTASSFSFFTLAYGATQSVSFVTATDVDSSGGQTIYDYKSVLLRTINWNDLNPTTVGTIARSFVE